jgi:hypothetical protein
VRDGARCQQPLRAIEIRQHAFKQPCPLYQRPFEPLPLVGGDDQRDEVDSPGLRRASRVREQVIGDARLPHLGIELLHASRTGRRIERLERLQQQLPVRLEGARAVGELIKTSGRGPITSCKVATPKVGCMGTSAHLLVSDTSASSPCREAIVYPAEPASMAPSRQHRRRYPLRA